MAGTSDGKPLTQAEAKARLLALGQPQSGVARILGSPLAQAGALVLGGIVVGRFFARRRPGTGASLGDLALRAGAAAAPLLVQQFIRGVTRHAEGNSRPFDRAETQR